MYFEYLPDEVEDQKQAVRRPIPQRHEQLSELTPEQQAQLHQCNVLRKEAKERGIPSPRAPPFMSMHFVSPEEEAQQAQLWQFYQAQQRSPPSPRRSPRSRSRSTSPSRPPLNDWRTQQQVRVPSPRLRPMPIPPINSRPPPYNLPPPMPVVVRLADMPLPFPHAVRQAEETINRALAEGRIRDPAYLMAYMMLTNKEMRKQLYDALRNGATID